MNRILAAATAALLVSTGIAVAQSDPAGRPINPAGIVSKDAAVPAGIVSKDAMAPAGIVSKDAAVPAGIANKGAAPAPTGK